MFVGRSTPTRFERKRRRGFRAHRGPTIRQVAPSDAINAVEVVLRDLIEQVLSEEFGEAWIEQCGTPEKIEKWRERKLEEAKRRDGTTTEERVLSYSDFTDLARAIKKHWELFKALPWGSQNIRRLHGPPGGVPERADALSDTCSL